MPRAISESEDCESFQMRADGTIVTRALRCQEEILSVLTVEPRTVRKSSAGDGQSS
jgi:hypothetical protein